MSVSSSSGGCISAPVGGLAALLVGCAEHNEQAHQQQQQGDSLPLSRTPHGVVSGVPTVGCAAHTKFCAKRLPAISVDEYLERILSYAQCSEVCLPCGVVLADRFLGSGAGVSLTPLTVHRVIATAVLVSAKVHDDDVFSNAYWAQVCGVSLDELNALEGIFLSAVGWDCSVKPVQLTQCVSAAAAAVPRGKARVRGVTRALRRAAGWALDAAAGPAAHAPALSAAAA